MSQNLSLAQQFAWSLATSLMVCITLFRAEGVGRCQVAGREESWSVSFAIAASAASGHWSGAWHGSAPSLVGATVLCCGRPSTSWVGMGAEPGRGFWPIQAL